MTQHWTWSIFHRCVIRPCCLPFGLYIRHPSSLQYPNNKLIRVWKWFALILSLTYKNSILIFWIANVRRQIWFICTSTSWVIVFNWRLNCISKRFIWLEQSVNTLQHYANYATHFGDMKYLINYSKILLKYIYNVKQMNCTDGMKKN